MSVTTSAALLALFLLVSAGTSAQEPYDVVLSGGRVMDPESGVDRVLDVGISDGVVRAMSTTPLQGLQRIDASAMVVAPGFIDLHQHAHTPAVYVVKSLDGATSVFDLESGTADVDKWYRERDGRAPIHHGVAVGHVPVRSAVMGDPGGLTPSGDGARRVATSGEIAEIVKRIDVGLQEGAVAVGVLLAPVPAVTPGRAIRAAR